jgi:hypothetical protein
MRRLADLAFFLQQYEMAFNTYHTVKKECGEKHFKLFAACEVCLPQYPESLLKYVGNALNLSLYARFAAA